MRNSVRDDKDARWRSRASSHLSHFTANLLASILRIGWSARAESGSEVHTRLLAVLFKEVCVEPDGERDVTPKT
jgi:hypothetical protein